MRGIKLNMMHKIKNARHKINMVRKKKKKKKRGAVRKRGGESRNQKRRKRGKKKKMGQRWVQRAKKGRTGPVWFKERKTEPVQPLYKGSGPVFFIFLKAFLSLLFSLFPFSLFSFLLSEVLCGQEHPPARRPLAAPPCRSSSSPPSFFYLSNPLHSLVMNLRFVFEKLNAASLDLNSKRTGSYPFPSCSAGLKRPWAGDWWVRAV